MIRLQCVYHKWLDTHNKNRQFRQKLIFQVLNLLCMLMQDFI